MFAIETNKGYKLASRKTRDDLNLNCFNYQSKSGLCISNQFKSDFPSTHPFFNMCTDRTIRYDCEHKYTEQNFCDTARNRANDDGRPVNMREHACADQVCIGNGAYSIL